MNRVKIYRIPSKSERAAMDRKIAESIGLTYDKWLSLEDSDREKLKAESAAVKKSAASMATRREHERYYANESGMSVEEWKKLDVETRKAKKDEIDVRDKVARAALREEKKERAAIARLKSEAAKLARNKPAKKMPQGLPGATRLSTITGLMSSPTDRKWNLFLREGPYWNYMVNYIRAKDVFKGRKDRVEEAVQNACAKIGKYMVAKRYKYPEVGKGYFRKFIKVVALRTAIDLFKEIRRQEQIMVEEPIANGRSEFDKIHDDMQRAHANCGKRLAKKPPAGGVDAEIEPPSERDLDVYDASAGFDRNIVPEKKGRSEGKLHDIASLDENPFNDDEAPSTYQPADMFDYRVKVSKKDMGWLQRLQIHVLYIALGYVLSDKKISAERREMLRLRYGLDMKVKDIYAMPRFAAKTRDAFDVQMKYATDQLRNEAKSWWNLVSPSKNDFADEAVMKLWRKLSGSDDRARLANDLQDKAIGIAGRIK